jgi:hypothetical protein
MPPSLHDRLAAALRDARTQGGFGPLAGAAPEPEPTAVATLALDDPAGREWLAANQHADGRFTVVRGPVESTAATALAALALDAGAARDRALDALPGLRVRRTPREALVPHDPTTRGWGWTPATSAWVEPTAWAVLALRRLRPDSPAIADGLRVLADRECVEGGWNYGNRVVYGVEIEPFVHTTATALLALQGVEPDLVARARRLLLARWPSEPGGLSLAVTLAALRLTGEAPGDEIVTALTASFDTTRFLGSVLALAWATLATGPGLERLRVPPASERRP